MALLSFEQELERATEKVPFSNGFEFDCWSSIWCDECTHFTDCPLLLVILHEKTPAAWDEIDPAALNRYHCGEFEEKTMPLPKGADENETVQAQD